MRHAILIIDSNAEDYRHEILNAGFDVDVHAVTTPTAAIDFLPTATVICGLSPVFNDELIRSAPRVQWIQALTTGTETITTSTFLPPGTSVTNMRGIHGPQMAELAILQMMSLCRHYRQILANQADQLWERWAQPVLAGKTAGILGVGEISLVLAARLKAFEMTVVGFTASPDRAAPNFDHLVSRSRLTELAPTLDFLIVLVPQSPQTDCIVSADVLRGMRSDAYLVNMARGGVVDEDALLVALEQGSIAGAALDVFREEPLPTSHSFWHLPNLLVTPHIGGMSTTYVRQAMPMLLRNVGLFLDGARGADLQNFVFQSSKHSRIKVAQ
ncbi:D-2-hydroxyacid dehydrogenase [Paraburkholderia nemoris]|uniref:D-2-hydroxyacid dehydrogenase n=1 Tax=Paraburkholderia nemoris TaxID=2793076 RepID=UPI0038B83219